jgi:hypothetical protein
MQPNSNHKDPRISIETLKGKLHQHVPEGYFEWQEKKLLEIPARHPQGRIRSLIPVYALGAVAATMALLLMFNMILPLFQKHSIEISEQQALEYMDLQYDAMDPSLQLLIMDAYIRCPIEYGYRMATDETSNTADDSEVSGESDRVPD